jgi:hypothetical protein
LKNRISNTLAIIVLAIIVVFLAADVGYSLYQPDRLDDALPSCTLQIISGDVSIMKKDGISWLTASDGMALEPGSRVRTSDNAEASLIFSVGTTSKLEPGTDVIIASLDESSESAPDLVVLKQQTGKTWNLVAKSDAECSFQIKTSSADIMVHGTLFSTEVNDSGQTSVETAEGEVSVKARDEEVRLLAGEMTTVKRGTTPSFPAPVPTPENELVFTIDKPVAALVTDPGGSSTGYLADSSMVNQISGSRITSDEDLTESIRIRNARTGEYTVTLRGVTDASCLSVEGFAEGESAFVHSESSNTTSAGDLIVKLHCDVIDGVLQNVSVLNTSSEEQQPTTVYTAAAIPPVDTEQPASSTGTPGSGAADYGEPWDGIARGPEGPWAWTNNLLQWLTIACTVVLMGSLYIFIHKRS